MLNIPPGLPPDETGDLPGFENVFDKSRVDNTRFWSPTWDKDKTLRHTAAVKAARAAALNASLCGVQDHEILDDLNDAWPELGIVSVSTVSCGVRVLIEAK